jgi:dihydrodipicolinate synthase/N-acetylneuraminate lyase
MVYPPKGLIISLPSPLDEKGGIDRVSLSRLIDRVLPFADGLFIGEPLAGEGLFLSHPLRTELLLAAIPMAAGRKPLFLSPTAATAEETLSTVETVSQAASAAACLDHLFWVDLPLWYHSNRKLPQFYEEWAKRTSCPILLYNHPQMISRLNRSLKRSNIRTAVLKSLAENEQIVGLIQAGELKRTIHYQRALRARRDFRFFDGEEDSFLNSPSSSGVVSFGANLLPAEWKEIVAASLDLSEDPARNLLLLKRSHKLRALHHALGLYPAKNIKTVLHRLGVIERADLLAGTPRAAAGNEDPFGAFLREHFPLQIPD